MKNSVLPSFHAAAFTLLAAVLVATPGDGRADEAAVSDAQYTWDLSEFYASQAAWESELERLRGEVDSLAHAGKLGDDAATLLALEANSAPNANSRDSGPMLPSAQRNLGAPEGQEMVGRIQALAQWRVPRRVFSRKS